MAGRERKKEKQITLSFIQKMKNTSAAGWEYACRKMNQPEVSRILYNVLVVVNLNEGISQDGVSAALQMDKSFTAKMVAKAIRMKYIDRKVNPEDRREYQLYLREEGSQIIEKLYAALDEWIDLVFKDVSSADKKIFLKTLTKMEKTQTDDQKTDHKDTGTCRQVLFFAKKPYASGIRLYEFTR